MTDKLELKSGHEIVYTVYVADVESIFYCKPDDPDILTVLMNDGKRLYCDEVCPIDSLQEEPVSKDFEMALAEMVAKAQKCVVEPWVVAAQWKDELIKLAKSEEPVSIWHDASEEPDDMSHCLIFYGCKESVGRYLHYEPVLYNKKEKVFITPSFPHPTGYKVEQKSFDGGCVAEVYKNRRDRISISDITQWCYLYDLHNISNIEKTEKCGKEEPVSDDLEKAAREHSNNLDNIRGSIGEMVRNAYKAGAKWQKENLWKSADGDDLPEIDREVIVLTQPYPLEGSEYVVSFAHRPNPNGWDGKSLTTGKVEHYTPKTYGKGGWNIPDVKYWLDCQIPN